MSPTLRATHAHIHTHACAHVRRNTKISSATARPVCVRASTAAPEHQSASQFTGAAAPRCPFLHDRPVRASVRACARHGLYIPVCICTARRRALDMCMVLYVLQISRRAASASALHAHTSNEIPIMLKGNNRICIYIDVHTYIHVR